MDRLNVQTTQNVVIEYTVAGLGTRFLSAMIDFFILLCYAIGMGYLLNEMGMYSFESYWMYYLVVMLPYFLYHPVCETLFEGQSLGKKQMNIKVVRVDGTPAGLGNYIIRWLFRLIDVVITMGGLAVVTIILNGKGQRLGDIAGGTAVVNVEKKTDILRALNAVPDEDYEPMFREAKKLADKDVALLKNILDTARSTDNNEAIWQLATKLRSMLNVETDLPPRKFIETVIKDYNHYNS